MLHDLRILSPALVLNEGVITGGKRDPGLEVLIDDRPAGNLALVALYKPAAVEIDNQGSGLRGFSLPEIQHVAGVLGVVLLVLVGRLFPGPKSRNPASHPKCRHQKR